MTRTELFEFWPGDGAIGLGIPIGVVDREVDRGVALARELDHSANGIVGHARLARGFHLALQRGIALGIEAVVAVGLAIDASLEDGVQPLGEDLEPVTRAATFCSSVTFQLM